MKILVDYDFVNAAMLHLRDYVRSDDGERMNSLRDSASYVANVLEAALKESENESRKMG